MNTPIQSDKKGKTDRRIIRTKRAIYRAMSELMAEKRLDQITVTDVANKADINRKTFYTYYSSPDDVIDEAIHDSLKAFAADIEHYDFQKGEKEPDYTIRFISSHRPKSPFHEGVSLLDSNVDRVWEKMCLIMKDKTREHLRRKLPQADPDRIQYVTEFMFSGYYRLLKLYGEKNHIDPSKKDLAPPDGDFLQLTRQLMQACRSVL